jgi:hypothetical protein
MCATCPSISFDSLFCSDGLRGSQSWSWVTCNHAFLRILAETNSTEVWLIAFGPRNVSCVRNILVSVMLYSRCDVDYWSAAEVVWICLMHSNTVIYF